MTEQPGAEQTRMSGDIDSVPSVVGGVPDDLMAHELPTIGHTTWRWSLSLRTQKDCPLSRPWLSAGDWPTLRKGIAAE